MFRCGIFAFMLLVNFGFVFADQEASLDLEPIVISKNKVHLLEVYTLESEDLKESTLSSPFERLSLLPLDLESRSPQQDIQTDFSLRGSTFQGVLLLLDGQRINDPQTAHYNCDIPLTREDIEKIEVVPDASSSLFGPDAIGGAVNILLKEPKENKIVIELGGGSYQGKSGLFSISRKKENSGIRFSLERQESEGFSYDTDFKKFTTRLDSSMDLPCGKFNLGMGYLEKEFGAYDFYTPGLGYPSKEWTKTYLFNTGIILDKEGLIIKPNFLWRRHYDKFMLDKTGLRSKYLNHHQSDVYTPNLYFQKDTEVFGKIGWGLEYGQERIISTNLGKHGRNHKSIFMDENKDLTSRFSFGLSGRWDDFEGFESIYTGALNLKFRLSEKGEFYLGMGKNIRIPSFTELYYSDPTTSGNPNLCAEKALNYQFGYSYKEGKLSAGITFFLRQEKNLLDWIKRTPSQAKWQIENITEAEVKGIENYLKFNLNQHFSIDSNYTYINKRIDDHGYLYKYGPNYASHLINTVFSFHLPFGLQSISATYKKRPGRDGWFLLNTHFSYNFRKNSQLFLEISNLLNVGYQEIVGIPQPGRCSQAGVRVEW
jgi:iron complex outermembrane receptor protein